ncbi:3-dehydroquinate dehydratase-1 [Arcanobacterium pluranimalium]|uniref:type I 3-dehydroquinate dehydratase n=1 Tax=Arcanobacterium pluranimalium TaxID=108028 RepID=UPI00195816E7|nr:type I 3-dehydroquinate dehydratase [Arcanobacterium pluranimalium]MBM7824352.1 3-dehydroquinate dehydratase-1 [Arcanobacterium pluranimalium]
MIFDESKKPSVIVPLTGTTTQMLIEQACAAEAAGADVIEWRIDFMIGAHQNLSFTSLGREIIEPILENTTVPLLLTIRTMEQGGQVKLSDGRYRILLAEMLDTLNYLQVPAERIGIDLEFRFEGTPALCVRAQKLGYTVVLSHHDWNETPDLEVMYLLFDEMLELKGAVAKLAVTPREESDVDALLATARKVSRERRRPIIALSMGELGKRSRLEGWKFGSIATFAAVGEGSAPGQPSVAELREALNAGG